VTASRARYRAPEFYGDASALHSVSSVAAPLLAGGALALGGVVIQQQDALRYPGAVLLLLVLAVFALVFAVQSGFWAQRHWATPSDMEQWYGHLPEQDVIEIVEEDAADDRVSYRLWAARTGVGFAVGLVLLWAAFGTAIIPSEGDEQTVLRWIASATAYAAAAFEVVWTVVSWKFRNARILTGLPASGR
jgi:hypothetical protein